MRKNKIYFLILFITFLLHNVNLAQTYAVGEGPEEERSSTPYVNAGSFHSDNIIHWPVSTVDIYYKVTQALQSIPVNDVVSEIGNAISTWNQVSTAEISLNNFGNDSQGALGFDYTNMIYFAYDGDPESYPNAAKTIWTFNVNEELLDVDILVNAKSSDTSGWTWYIGNDGDNMPSGYRELRTVLIHELGHLLSLHHTGNPSSVMNTNAQKVMHTLGEGDEFAVSYVYVGNIISDKTFPSFDTFHCDFGLKILAGVHVTFNPGTTYKFDYGTSMQIWGNITADGTSGTITFTAGENENAWGGIQFKNGSTASISYANIQNATTGVKFESSSSGSVSNSTLSNNAYGIYIAGAEPTIESNTISSNSYGIYVTNSYSPSWTVEHIKNNSIQSNSAYGLYLYNSSPTLSGNTVSACYNGTALFTNCNSKVYDNDFVSNSSYGFACYGSSSPSVYYNTNYSFGGYNSFLSNGGDEVRITGSSNPNFGNYFFEGNNSFDDNSGYLMYNSTGSTISAENNWWGSSSGPGVNQIYGSVDYDPYLDEDPNNPSRAVFIDNPSLAVSNINSPEDLSNAFNAYYEGNFTLAASLFKEYLNQNPKSESALEIIQYYLQSLNMYKSRADMLSDIDILLRLKLNDNIRNEVISLYAAYLELNGNYNKALQQLESLEEKETEDEFKNRIKLQKAYLLINSKKDTENAKALFEEVLKNTSNDSYLFEIASAELNNLSGTRSAFAHALVKKTDSNEEKNTFWLKNYPNPFNAETVIKFSLPKESDVEIAVYNILGQKIAMLLIDKLPAGQHNIKLNAANFASGIYFVTLSTGSEMQTIKVSLMK